MDLELLKGTRDYLPETQILRQRVADTIKETYELFGFSPAETPILNHFDVLASKYAGGAEILKETYRLSDQGERDLGLRYDLTVPFARMVGMYQGGRLPAVFKRYEIGRVFRNGPVKTGRMREFTQCDADVVGPPGMNTAAADAEFIAIADRVFGKLGIPAYCQVNDRRYLHEVLHRCGTPDDRMSDAILAVDKIAKIGVAGVAEDLRSRGLDPGIAERFAQGTGGDGTLLSTFDRYKGTMDTWPGYLELLALEGHLRTLNVSMPVVHQPGLARGLEIYTGTVFEFFWRDPTADAKSLRPNPELSSSLAAGGRYDKIVGQFLHPDEPAKHGNYPAAGLSFGLDVLTKVLELMQGEAGRRATVTEVLIFAFGPGEELAFAMKTAAELRDRGVRTEVDYAHKRIKNSVEFANKANIPFHAAVGGDEVKAGKLMLKNLATGDKGLVTSAEAAERVAASRK